MERFSFPATFTLDEIDGGYVVTFKDLPEAITQGNTISECITEATDCLEEAIAARIDEELDIPLPSKAVNGEQLIYSPLQMAFKAAVYLTMKESGITKVELARRMGVAEKEARRILDPRHSTRLPLLEQALQVLGK